MPLFEVIFFLQYVLWFEQDHLILFSTLILIITLGHAFTGFLFASSLCEICLMCISIFGNCLSSDLKFKKNILCFYEPNSQVIRSISLTMLYEIQWFECHQHVIVWKFGFMSTSVDYLNLIEELRKVLKTWN